jgi:hypothetical protein
LFRCNVDSAGNAPAAAKREQPLRITGSQQKGEKLMAVLGGARQELQSAKPAIAEGNIPAALAEFVTQGAPRGSKLKISIEKKIENIWLESKELGWSYNDFVSHLLEVLVVLNHRSFLPKLNSNEKSSEKATAS